MVKYAGGALIPPIRIDRDDPYFNELHDQWTRAQTAARRAMPEPPWMKG